MSRPFPSLAPKFNCNRTCHRIPVLISMFPCLVHSSTTTPYLPTHHTILQVPIRISTNQICFLIRFILMSCLKGYNHKIPKYIITMEGCYIVTNSIKRCGCGTVWRLTLLNPIFDACTRLVLKYFF